MSKDGYSPIAKKPNPLQEFPYCKSRKELIQNMPTTHINGVPIESVSKMLVHRSLRTTQHYAKVLDRKVSDYMKLLKSKLGDFKLDNNISNGTDL